MFVCDVPGAPADEPDPERDAAADPPTASKGPMVFVNPVIEELSRDMVAFEEGCLSLPEIRGDVRRPSVVTVSAQDVEGNAFRMTAGGLLGRCIQHEFDHLEGVLILSKFSRLDRMRVRSAVAGLEAAGA